jgi:pyruvate formate lyase activating enzyme
MINRKEKIAFFAGLSAFIGVFENFIPTPIPILRLGFSNIPICLGFTIFNFWESFFITIFKTVFSHFFRGTLFSYPFLIGLSGSLLFIIFSYPFYKIFKKHISFVSLSLVGSLLHNLGQIIVSFLFIPSQAVIYFAIILLSVGSVAGFINGIICNIIYNKVFVRFFMDDKLFILKNDKVQCLLCPNKCVLNDGQFGLCNIRKREKDKIVNPYSGILSGSSMDPIEKKPLYHFMPKTSIYSVGFFGCTLKCQFCQNYSISQTTPIGNEEKITPKEMVNYLIKNNIKSIAFTYSEPTLYYEWVLETAKLCKKEGIKTVLVTNGYLNPNPAEMLLEYIDAANIDLKSSKDDFYKKYCSAKIDPVKKFIEIAFSKNVHVEITTLVITGTNDDISECIEISDFIASISKDIPFHISKYYPCYKLDAPATKVETILEWVKEAKSKLNYVYGGNIADEGNSYCKNCKEILIERKGYFINILNIDSNGKCKKCCVDNYFHY